MDDGADEVGTAGPTCDNCGRAATDLALVQRVWVLPAPALDPDVEAWCASCRSQYPHAEAPGAP